MALSILDGNQSATTLSTILSSGQHITAHTVVSLGTQAITDMRGAVSGSVVSISNFPATQPVSIASVTVGNTVTIAGTVTANVGNAVVIQVVNAVQDGDGTTFGIDRDFPISGTVTANSFISNVEEAYDEAINQNVLAVHLKDLSGNVLGTSGTPLPISGTVTANPTGTQTIAGSVTLGASTAQIGSVTASISGTVPVSGTFFQATQPVSLTTLPALVAGTAQIGSVTASISNSVTIASLPAISGTVTANGGNFSSLNTSQPENKIQVGFQTTGGDFVAVNEDGQPFPVNVFIDGTKVQSSNPLPISGTVTASLPISSNTITKGSFTSLASATLVPANTSRKMATVYNLGAGQLFVNAGETATTLGGGFMVALSSGDFYECDYTTTTLSAIFSTAGTASWVSH
jgi:hypothetical protein